MAVLKLLTKSKFYLDCRKYAMFLPEVEFLGHTVFECGLSVSPGKVSVVWNWPLLSFFHYI